MKRSLVFLALNMTSLFWFAEAIAQRTSAVLIRENGRWSTSVELPNEECNSVWGSSRDNVFVTSRFGRIFRFDGKQWTTVFESARGRERFRAISGISANNIYAVGEEGTVMHFDGERWTDRNTGSGELFLGVSVAPAHQIFTVGYMFPPSGGGGVKHFDGKEWSWDISGDTLWDVWRATSGEVVAVGFHKAAMVHFDGRIWEIKSHEEDRNYMTGVWGRSADDVYAVGASASGDRGRGQVLHFDGTDWSVVFTIPDVWLRDVWGDGSGRVFVVGKGGVVFEFDGAQWSRAKTDTDLDFWGVWSTFKGDAFAVAAR